MCTYRFDVCGGLLFFLFIYFFYILNGDLNKNCNYINAYMVIRRIYINECVWRLMEVNDDNYKEYR